uniref:CxC6 like cysteine cluster associated with KDZ domain-containing protein n=1 Tax=viral metagenome TaxID=1070528 RepID=A0A6C0HK78_9ZZZZ
MAEANPHALICKKDGCKQPPIKRGKYCEVHRSIKTKCEVENCTNASQRNTGKCIRHGYF